MTNKSLIFLFMVFTAFSIKAQTDFGSQNIIFEGGKTQAPISVHAADLDGDGDQDILSASMNDSKIAWYENTDGHGAFGPQQIITTSLEFAKDVFTADLDGDGDLDVLSASSYDNKIAWYENTDGNGTFSAQQIITTSALIAQSVFAADLDGDGDQDVLSASFADDKIAWYENTDGHGTFGPQQIIDTTADGAYSVCTADLDGDGDLDVLSASTNDDIIAWYENTDGNGTFGTRQVITSSAEYAISVFAVDLDGDGDQDVLSASTDDDKIAWYENTDGNGTFSAQQIITTSADAAQSVFAADLDGDGDQDVLSASFADDKIAWYENTDGNGTFGAQTVITTSADGSRSIFVADLDGDGNADLISASQYDNKIAWYKNTDGNGTFGVQQAITSANTVISVYASDIDGDGDLDVLSASFLESNITWQENLDGKGTFGVKRVVSTVAKNTRSVYAVDLDGDGDQDILSASEGDNKIAWYENIDGYGTYGTQQVITYSTNGAMSVFAADMDGDGDQDVLSASRYDDKIAWYENTDGNGTFGPQQVITTSTDGASSAYAADIDRDGDLDVISASFEDNEIAWYENTDGLGTFGEQHVITTSAEYAFSVYAGDLDDDGDLDILSASRADNKIAWYENTDGLGTFGEQQIITISAIHANSVYAVDLDGDGDLDVLSASPGDDKIAWYENTDRQGTFGEQQIITTSAIGAVIVYTADLDGDGDQDVLSASLDDEKTAWYENLANDNTRVNSLNQEGILIYPNPTKGIINLRFAHDNVQKLTVSLITGIQVIQKSPVQTDEILDLSDYKSGIYIISIQTDIETFKINIVKD